MLIHQELTYENALCSLLIFSLLYLAVYSNKKYKFRNFEFVRAPKSLGQTLPTEQFLEVKFKLWRWVKRLYDTISLMYFTDLYSFLLATTTQTHTNLLLLQWKSSVFTYWVREALFSNKSFNLWRVSVSVLMVTQNGEITYLLVISNSQYQNPFLHYFL